MLSIIGFVVAAAAGFVGGVLFGRKNKRKVEEVVDKVEDLVHKK